MIPTIIDIINVVILMVVWASGLLVGWFLWGHSR